MVTSVHGLIALLCALEDIGLYREDRYGLTDTWLDTVHMKLNQFDGLSTTIMIIMLEVLCKDAVTTM